jgi:pimeloyl-ACP methyl ester carboxylesterase
MAKRLTSTLRPRMLSTALLATVLLIIGGIQASAEPSQTPFKIAWSACEQSPQTQCGTLKVPLDWSKPSGPTISLAIMRRPAKDPQHRVGTLFFNPGGPGDGPADYLTQAETIFTPTLIERFDLVGMDPRGIANSSQVRCTLPVITPETTLFPKTEQQFLQLQQHNREVGLNCLDHAGELVRHMDTISVARDHEALRQALGENKINWLGISYGTQLAANYAQLYPTRTQAMVLDAPLEHSQAEVHQVADEIIAAEDSFNRFADWCPTKDTCALRGQDVRAVFDRLVQQADQNPIPAEGALRPVTGEDIRMRTTRLLIIKEPSIYGPDLSWAGLSRALQKAIDGNASAFAVAPAGEPQYGYHGVLANVCLDYVPQVHTYAEMQQRLELGRQLAPPFARCLTNLAGQLLHRLACQARQPAQNAERPGSADANDPRRSRSKRFLYLGPRSSSTDRWQHAVDAYWRWSYVGLYLRLRQVSHGCVLDRTAQRGQPHL